MLNKSICFAVTRKKLNYKSGVKFKQSIQMKTDADLL